MKMYSNLFLHAFLLQIKIDMKSYSAKYFYDFESIKKKLLKFHDFESSKEQRKYKKNQILFIFDSFSFL